MRHILNMSKMQSHSESLTSQHEELIVCKSMSKCYALSGLRVAYAVTANAAFYVDLFHLGR